MIYAPESQRICIIIMAWTAEESPQSLSPKVWNLFLVVKKNWQRLRWYLISKGLGPLVWPDSLAPPRDRSNWIAKCINHVPLPRRPKKTELDFTQNREWRSENGECLRLAFGWLFGRNYVNAWVETLNLKRVGGAEAPITSVCCWVNWRSVGNLDWELPSEKQLLDTHLGTMYRTFFMVSQEQETITNGFKWPVWLNSVLVLLNVLSGWSIKPYNSAIQWKSVFFRWILILINYKRMVKIISERNKCKIKVLFKY